MDPVRILVVEDQVALRNLLERYIRRMGFEVESLSDPKAALERFLGSEPKFRLVVADMTMPVLSGEELLRAVLAADPHVLGILCSGYPVGTTALETDYPGRTEFLQKPFSPQGLGEIIGRLLGTAAGGAP